MRTPPRSPRLAGRRRGRLPPTERVNPASGNLDRLSPISIVRLMAREDSRVPRAVAAQARNIARAVELISGALSAGGRLVFVGAGTSGRLGVIEAAECPPTFGTPPSSVKAVMAGGRSAVFRSKEGAEDDPADGARRVRRLVRRGDAVVGIAASGITPFVKGALREARARGCRTVLVTSNARPDARGVEVVIAPRVGPEVLTGSTRLKSGTAAKLVLNILTTASMVRLGKTYGNRMVDLQVTNAKLGRRAQGLVRELGRCGPARAKRLMRSSKGSVKLAVLMARLELSPAQGRRLLVCAGGSLRKALGG